MNATKKGASAEEVNQAMKSFLSKVNTIQGLRAYNTERFNESNHFAEKDAENTDERGSLHPDPW